MFLFRAGQTILPVSLLPPPGTITIEKSSAVGTVVGVRVLSFLCYGIPSPFVHPPQVLIVMCLLGAGLGYFAYSNRRMRTRSVQKIRKTTTKNEIERKLNDFSHNQISGTQFRFREFTAGHYSSATGTATLIDDDDESPIIRGFRWIYFVPLNGN